MIIAGILSALVSAFLTVVGAIFLIFFLLLLWGYMDGD